MKQLAPFFKFSSIIALLGAAALNTNAAEIVVNGGFETGTTTTAPPWTYTDSSNFTGFASNAAFAHSGTRYAFLGATGTIGILQQDLSTSTGGMYDLSFWLANDGGIPPNSFQPYWNGSPLLGLINAPGFGYTQFTYLNLVATGTSTTLEFRSRNDQDFFRLDDVSVTDATGSVPEGGATFWLGLPVFGGLCLVGQVRARKRFAA